MMVFLAPAQAARLWPKRDTHYVTVVRAIVRGVASKQRPGQRIKLRAIRDSQGWKTTSAWVEEFFHEITTDRGGSPPRETVRDRAQRARNRLKASGFFKETQTK
jgi:hypothetical protein